MIITATEFKNKVGKFLKAAQDEDVIISKNGKYIAKLSTVKEYEYPATENLVGVFEKAADYNIEDAREERLKKYESTD
ncbi:MAG: type II toxin-antitoxin system Phd/YefM family antitoxin [Bacillota bacterium]